MAAPTIKVEVAFEDNPENALPVWSDVTEFVRAETGVSITRGRADEFSEIQPGRLTLTLDNTAGEFTYGNAASPYFPYVIPYRRIRVSVYVNGAWYPRFDGYIDGWPISWVDDFGGVALVNVSATDRLARLTKLRAIKHPVAEQFGTGSKSGWVLDDGTRGLLDTAAVLADGPGWLYGLQEESGSSSASDVSGNPGNPALQDLTMGTGGGIHGYGQENVFLEGRAIYGVGDGSGNGVVTGSATLTTYVGSAFSFGCAFRWYLGSVLEIASVGHVGGSSVVLAATGSTVTATFTAAPGGTPVVVTKTVTTNDLIPHYVMVTVSGSTISLYVDGESAATGSVPSGMSTAVGVRVGTTGSTAGYYSWLGYVPRALSATEVANVASLITGEAKASHEWVSLWLGWLGMSSLLSAETGLSDVAYQPMAEKSVLELIGNVNRVESGWFFAKPDGTYTFQARSHRYNRSPIITLDADLGQVPTGLAMGVDTGRLVNDVTMSRGNGSAAHAVNQDSINTYGVFSTVGSVYAASDADLQSVAYWIVNRQGTVAVRVPTVTIDLLTVTELQSVAVLAEVGELLELTNLPTQAPETSMSFYIEGVSEKISISEWSLQLNTSPGLALTQVWALEDPALGLLDTTTVLAY